MRFAGQGLVLALALLAWLGLGGQVGITPFMLVGAAFVISGLAAWWLRPRNRLGPLMAIAGLGLLLETDQSLVPEWLGILLQVISFPVLIIPIQVLLAFPDGVVRTPRQRVFVRSLYVLTTLGAASALAAFARTNSPVLAGVINGVAEGIYLVSFTAASVLTFRRWRKGSSAVRRGLGPVVWSLIPALAALWAPPAGSLIRPQLDLLFGQPMAYLEAGLPVLLAALPAGVLIGLLRAELDMSSVGELVIKLSDGLLPQQVEPALAQVLHDPSLKVVYWLPTLSRFGDLEGNPVDLAQSDPTKAISVLGEPSNPVAALVYDPSLRDEARLVDTAGAALRLALENARLQAQLRAQLRDVGESRARLVEAADRERRRVERDLHDGAQQQLVTILLAMQLARTEALQRSEVKTAQTIERSVESLKRALSELRELARGIHPAILVEAGLNPAIRALAERCPVPVEITGDLGRLDGRLEAALYFVVAEALTNAAKHAQSQKVRVDLRRSNGLAFVDIADDGVGGADLSRGSGLVGLSDRMAAVGGRLDVKSDVGHGTKLHAEVPCE